MNPNTAESPSRSGAYWFKVLIAVDIFACALLLRDSDLTISSDCGLALRATPDGTQFLCRLGRFLNAISKDHCETAIANDLLAAQQAVERLKPTGK